MNPLIALTILAAFFTGLAVATDTPACWSCAWSEATR